MKGKNTKIIVIIVGILILGCICIFNILKFKDIKHTINDPYIIFGEVTSYNSNEGNRDYLYYYISEDGYVVEVQIEKGHVIIVSNKSNNELILSKEEGKDKERLIKKISKKDVEDLEKYIIEQERDIYVNENGQLVMNPDSGILGQGDIIWIKNKGVFHDKDLIINLINKITE